MRNDLFDEQKTQITAALKKLWHLRENPAGEIIEDRHSQITMFALGQQATPEDKYAWAGKYKGYSSDISRQGGGRNRLA